MLPNVSSALLGWTQPVLVKTVTTTTVDFVETEVVTGKTVQAVVQPTKKTTLNADTLDWSQPHITLHSQTLLSLGQLVERNGADYKVVEVTDYGYCEAVCEATRRPVVEVTP
jgi:hypothetical protein